MNLFFLLYAVWLSARTCLSQTTPLRRYCRDRQGNVPHPTNCGQYLACNVRSVYVMNCPLSLHFNPTRGYCDYPARAQCRPRSISNPNDCPSILVCPSHVLYFEFPDWSNCSSFYVCTSGDLERRTCPDGLVYDFVNWRCTYPDEATCFEPQ